MSKGVIHAEAVGCDAASILGLVLSLQAHHQAASADAEDVRQRACRSSLF